MSLNSGKKNTLYLSVNVFRTKILLTELRALFLLLLSTGDGTAILRGYPSHAKV